jgi:inosine-uridine nucleoside N-ribohydrolase
LRQLMKIKKVILFVFTPVAFLMLLACTGNISNAKSSMAKAAIVGIPVIYETDMTLDVDDVGALAVLHGLQTEGKVNILGVCYNEVHPLAPDAIDAINTYYGRGTIPIGIYRKELVEPDPSDYFSSEREFDVDNMPHDSFDNIVADAVAVYKHLLKPQADDSVVIISVGFLNNLHDLLKDPEGLELVKSKVKLLAIMGGLHNDGFNLSRHDLVEQSQYVIENWPGTLVTTDVGGDMITGETLTSTTPTNNPVRRAYELEWHQGPNIGRCSWDQVTVMYAVFGTKYYVEDWDGGGSLKNGYSWTFSAGHRGYAAPKNDKEVEDEIERLMTLAP